MDPRTGRYGTGHGTGHDTSYGGPHDRSNFTYASSYTDLAPPRPYGQGPRNPSASYVEQQSQSYVMPGGEKVVVMEAGVDMFPSHPKTALVTSIVFTIICCFACSIPAIIYSKQAVDYQREGEKRLAARLANQIAFWLILSALTGILVWSMGFVFAYAYRFQ